MLKSILEEIISPSTESGTMTFWHGGNLNDIYNDMVAHKKGRFEYGAGLYLTSHYGTATKYAKGSRKLYQITIRKGIDISEVNINKDKCLNFINEFVIKNKKKEIIERMLKYDKNGIPADIFQNVIINEEAIKPANTTELRTFMVDNGIDYCIVDNAFGWHERMIVLFNTKLIVNQRIVKSNDKIEVFDLPTDWN